MKVSYQKGYASDYVYRQVIRAETKEERKDISSFLLLNGGKIKENGLYMESGITGTMELQRYTENKRIRRENTIYIFRG